MGRKSYTSIKSGRQGNQESASGLSRRDFMTGLGGVAVLNALPVRRASAETSQGPLNLARVAVPTSQTMRSENKISALNDGVIPENSFDRTHSLYALRSPSPE